MMPQRTFRHRALRFFWCRFIAVLFGQHALRIDYGLRSVRLLLLQTRPLRRHAGLHDRWWFWAARAHLTCLERSLAFFVCRWSVIYLCIGAAIPGPGGHARVWRNGRWLTDGAMRPWIVLKGCRQGADLRVRLHPTRLGRPSS